jgi:hypothetical protein
MSSKRHLQSILAAVIWLALAANAAGQSATNHIFAALAEREFLKAQALFQSATNNSTNGWNLARTGFDYCEFATNDAQRADIAKLGIAACRQLLARDSNSAPGHYYLAMNLGELAQAEAPSLAAYKLVHEVEREFELAAKLDVRFDYAGPARNLGELYFLAPGWPFSVGSKRKAREWLERAVALTPEFPVNLLNLAEAQLKWREPEAFAATMKNLDARWPAAQTNFTGELHEQDWSEWNTRRAALTAEAKKVFKHVP